LLDKDLYLGEFAESLMEKMKTKARAEIFQNIRSFYCSAVNYMNKKFPTNTELL